MKDKAYIFVTFESLSLILCLILFDIGMYNYISTSSFDRAWNSMNMGFEVSYQFIAVIAILAFIYYSVYSFLLFLAYTVGKQAFIFKLALANVIPIAFLYIIDGGMDLFFMLILLASQIIILLLGVMVY